MLNPFRYMIAQICSSIDEKEMAEEFINKIKINENGMSSFYKEFLEIDRKER